MKKFICLLTAIISFSLLITGCSNNSSSSTNAVVEANPASDFEYIENEAGDIVINKYIGSAAKVVIPQTIDGKNVTVIGKNAFSNNIIVSVTIPNTVTGIGLNAFKDCKELTEIIVPDGLETLVSGAFQNCEKLESVDISNTNITVLWNDSFSGCSNLKEIKLPESLLEIKQGAFSDCVSLLELHFPEKLTSIEDDTIVNCTALTTITIPKNLDLKSVSFPSIHNVPSLKEIIFEEGREEIQGYGFIDTTSNVEIRIPSSVKRFSALPFFIHGEAKVVFLGDFPEIIDDHEFYGNPTIFYDPHTEGWDNCEWKNQYPMIPLE